NASNLFDFWMQGDGSVVVLLDQDRFGTNGFSVIGHTPVNDGTFHRITYVREGVSGLLYIDGVLDATGLTGAITNISNSSDLLVGNGPLVGNYGFKAFNGQIDELTLYNQALSPDDVQNSNSPPATETISLPPLTVAAEHIIRLDQATQSTDRGGQANYVLE